MFCKRWIKQWNYGIRDIFWFFVVCKQINSLEASLGINQFVFYSCIMIRYSINLWRSLTVLEESSAVTFWMEVWVSDWFDCYIWLWCKYTKRSSSINAQFHQLTCNPNWEVALLIMLPYKVYLFWLYQFSDIASKSLITLIRNKRFCARVCKANSKLSESFKLIVGLIWRPVKDKKVTRFITNLKVTFTLCRRFLPN